MRNLLIALITTSILCSCSSVHHKRAVVLERENSIAALDKELHHAQSANVDILAPQSFARAQALYEKAMREAQSSKDANAGANTAAEGRGLLEKAKAISEQTRTFVAETLQQRARAKAAKADLIFPDEWKDLDRRLALATKEFEQDNHHRGVEKGAALAHAYSDLETKAMKEDVTMKASRAYDDAVQARALRYAPLTMKKAKNEIDIAKQIIEVETGNRDKAAFHGKRGLYFASQAKSIADIVTVFHQEGLTDEQKILWYQDQLSRIHKADVPEGLSFTRPNEEVVADLEMRVAELVKNLDVANRTAHKAISDRDLTLKEKEKADALYKTIGNMFSPSEAEVLKRDNDIIIRSHGFNFVVGKAELLPSNYSLLKKIVQAIKTVPNAMIEVEGHCDSTGSEAVNLDLSQRRAQNIVDYLIKVANVDANRIVAKGRGKKVPLVINETPADREINRRIEVVIKPQS